MTITIIVPPEVAQACADTTVVCWIEAHPGSAAWAALVAAILAMAATVLAAWLPVHLTQRADQRRKMSRAVQAALVADGLVSVFATAIETMPSALDADLVKEQASHVLSRLDQAATADLDIPAIGQQLTLLCTAVRGAREAALAAQDVAKQPDHLAELVKLAKDWHSKTSGYLDVVIRLARDAGCEVELISNSLNEPEAPRDP